ncbi:MAG: MFS transporter [Deltaproteobacteria bacterium]|nr:MFS transporter [Deltaproteobacteria bacterium]
MSISDKGYLRLLNIHYIFHFFAYSIIDLFGPIYLYKHGIPLPFVFFYVSAFCSARLVLRIYVLKLCSRFGTRKLFLSGIVSAAIVYPMYQNVQGLNFWLLAILIVNSYASTSYWTIYHAYFASAGTSVNRGKEVAVREGINQFVKFVSPICTGFLFEHVGAASAFWLGCLSAILSLFPVLKFPDLTFDTEPSAKVIWRNVDKTGFRVSVAGSMQHYGHVFAWNLIIFLTVDNYVGFGSLLGLAVLFQIVGFYVVGHYFDRGKSYLTSQLASLLFLLAIILRTQYGYDYVTILCFDVVYTIGAVLLLPVYASICYNAAQKSGDVVSFQYLSESGWDVGTVLSTLIGGLLLLHGVNIRNIPFLGIVGIVLLLYVIHRYHPENFNSKKLKTI